jgi:putative ABC transport system permease protein
MNPRWRKVLGDLRANRGQVLLVGLAILISVTAVLTAFGAESILTREVAASFERSLPADAVLLLNAVDDELVAAVQQQPGVLQAEARRLVRARVEVAPGDWRSLLLFVVRDFATMRVSRVTPERGAWPPPDGTVVVERSALSVLRADEGASLHLRLPGGAVADLPITGVVHDAGQAPGWQDNVGYAYASPATLARFGQGAHLDELRVRLAPGSTRDDAARVAGALTSWLREQGRVVERVEVPLREHPHADHMRTLLLLLKTFSLLALALTGALIVNLLSGLLARQVRQIGILKAIGATIYQMMGLYGRFVLLITALAVVVALPLGVVLAWTLTAFVMEQLNLKVSDWAVAPTVVVVVGVSSLLWPLLVAAVPVWRAARIRARDALHDTGVQLPPAHHRGSGVLTHWLDDRRLTFALRNTVRRPVRLALTLLALALGGAILLTAANVYTSLVAAVDTTLAMRGDDLDVRLLRPVPQNELLARVQGIPDVERVEAWGYALAAIELPDTAAAPVGTGRYGVLAPLSNTELLRLPVAEGRWSRPDEVGAVVVSRNIVAHEPGVRLGEPLTLVVGERRIPVSVVGILEDVAPPGLYTNAPTLALVAGQANMAGALRLTTEPGAQARVATAVEQALVDAGWLPSFLMTRDAYRASLIDHFAILLTLLLAAALAAVLVGGLGLATSVSLSVLERRRELGILRAMGATRRTVLRTLLLEGALVGGVSVLLAVVIALPLSAAVVNLTGTRGLYVAVPLVVSPVALLGWLLLAAVLTVVACSLPVRHALRRPTYEALAHET